MASKPRRAGMPQGNAHGAQKSRKEYVDRLERALREYTAEVDAEAKEVNTHKRDRGPGQRKDMGRNKDKGPGKGKVLNVLDKMRGGFGNTEQQAATKKRLQQFEKEKRKLQHESENLTQIAEHVQERVAVNSQRFTEAISSLQTELENAELARMGGIANLASLQQVSLQISDDIMSLRGVAEQQAAEEIKLMEDAFRKQIKAKVAEVERERSSRKNKTGEWIGKNKVLQIEVDRQLTLTEAKHTAAKKLKEARKRLSVEHSAQLEDKDILIRQSLSLQSHNKKLRERISELESIVHSLQTTDVPDDAGGMPGAPLIRSQLDEQGKSASGKEASRSDGQATQNEERLVRYQQALAKYQVILEAERRNLEGVRSAHVQALQQRTELEVLLKESLAWAIGEARKRLPPESAETVVLNEADRQAVVERLLSNDRVLQLLYGRDAVGDGVQGGGGADGGVGGASSGLPAPLPASSTDVDASELWDKWKQWTESAEA